MIKLGTDAFPKGKSGDRSRGGKIRLWEEIMKVRKLFGSGLALLGVLQAEHCTAASSSPPTATIAYPADGAVLKYGFALNVYAEASDSDGTVALVEFFGNGVKIGEDSTLQFGLDWTNALPGEYELTAVATDNAGDKGTSAPVRIFVVTNLPPGAAIGEPVNGTVFPQPTDILVHAAAYDNDGTIPLIEVFEGTNKLAELADSQSNFLWRDVGVGEYELRAIATDNWGAKGTSAVVRIAVENAPGEARGPYLQILTPTGVLVRWRTSGMLDSEVRVGTHYTNLNMVFKDEEPKTDHAIAVTGLLQNTKYYYSIGSSNAVSNYGPEHYFYTAPLQAKPTRIWAIGDAGTANANARSVRDAYLQFSQGRYTDLWLMLGDNAYSSGSDEDYQRAVFDMYPQLLKKTVVWPTIGNHDTAQATNAAPDLPYLQIFSLPTAGEAGGVASGTEQYYSYDYGNIHFVVLDSMTSLRNPGSPMLTWLEADLASTSADWIIAFWHHPPYTKANYDSDPPSQLREMRESVVPILERFGVDLVLCGHSHAYERSYFLNGHYGLSTNLTASMILNSGDGREDGLGAYLKPAGALSANQGAVYVVAGCAGQIAGNDRRHPAMFTTLFLLGSIVLDIDGLRLDAKFLDYGGQIADYFTLVKGDWTNGPSPRVEIRRDGSGAELRWPKTASYELERADRLDGNAHWTQVTNSPVIVGRTNILSLQSNSSNAFYRLKK